VSDTAFLEHEEACLKSMLTRSINDSRVKGGAEDADIKDGIGGRQALGMIQVCKGRDA
jgi:hypothetical protein